MSRSFVAASSQNLKRDSAVVSGAPCTFTAWIRPSSLTSTHVVFSTLIAQSAWTGFFGSVGPGGAWSAGAPVNNDFGGSSATAGGTITVNTWHHVAAVYASTTSRTSYADGVAGTPNTDSKVATGMNRCSIGAAYRTIPDNFWNGLIAEAAWYDVALTAAEIAAITKGYSPLLIRPESLVAYWPLIGRYSPEIDLVGGQAMALDNSPTAGNHPRVIYPARRRMIFVPASTGDSESSVPMLMLLGIG